MRCRSPCRAGCRGPAPPSRSAADTLPAPAPGPEPRTPGRPSVFCDAGNNLGDGRGRGVARHRGRGRDGLFRVRLRGRLRGLRGRRLRLSQPHDGEKDGGTSCQQASDAAVRHHRMSLAHPRGPRPREGDGAPELGWEFVAFLRRLVTLNPHAAASLLCRVSSVTNRGQDSSSAAAT